MIWFFPHSNEYFHTVLKRKLGFCNNLCVCVFFFHSLATICENFGKFVVKFMQAITTIWQENSHTSSLHVHKSGQCWNQYKTKLRTRTRKKERAQQQQRIWSLSIVSFDYWSQKRKNWRHALPMTYPSCQYSGFSFLCYFFVCCCSLFPSISIRYFTESYS